MANLTGEYDVTIEADIGLANRVLAAIHELHPGDAFPTLLHSLELPVADSARGPSDPVPETERTRVKGVAGVQISTPTLDVPAGPSASRLDLEVDARTWLREAAGDPVPEFLHGTLRIGAALYHEVLDGTENLVGIRRDSEMEVEFAPHEATSAPEDQLAVVNRVLRNFMIGDLAPVSVRAALPEGVRAMGVRTVSPPARPALMLMLSLTDRSLTDAARDRVTTGLLRGGADVAVAVGGDYLLPLLRAELPTEAATFRASGFLWSASGTVDWSRASLELGSGAATLTVPGTGRATVVGTFSFTVRQRFTVEVAGGSLQLRPAGDPSVDVRGAGFADGILAAIIRAQVRGAREAAVARANEAIRSRLDVSAQLSEILGRLHPSAPKVRLTDAEIRPDGLVVWLAVEFGPTRRAVATYRREPPDPETRGIRLSALESWIPGGTIRRFGWRLTNGFGREQIVEEEHRFVVDLPIDPWPWSVRCLEIEGTRVTPTGGGETVRAHSCGYFVPNILRALPTNRPQEYLLPLWTGAPGKDVAISGHFDPWRTTRAPSYGTTNLLVHFAASGWEDAGALARDVAERAAKRGAALVVLVVLPREQMATAQPFDLQGETAILLTDDPRDGWKRAFGVEKAPATFLSAGKPTPVWEHRGEITGEDLDGGIEPNLVPDGRLSWDHLLIRAGAGPRAPNFLFDLAHDRVPLRRLRGREIVLVFCASWSAPSIAELRRIQEVRARIGDGGPIVLAVADGDDAAVAQKVAKRERIEVEVIADPERRIAHLYGVGAWPTVVRIDGDVRLGAVHFGRGATSVGTKLQAGA